MPSFYEVTIIGTAQGQVINNVLYYLRDVGVPGLFDQAEAIAVGDAALDNWVANVLPSLSSSYALQGCNVDFIDENRTSLAPFLQGRSRSGAGGSAGTLDTPALVMIVSFQTTFIASGTGLRNPRRSYLALGPLNNAQVGDGGALALTAGEIIDVTDALEASLTLSTGPTLPPARVGTDNADGEPSAGIIASATIRPYASFRRSRLRPASG